MKKILFIAILTAIHSTAFASSVDYLIAEHFIDGSFFSGSFVYDITAQSLSQFHGTLTEVGGPVTIMSFDRNDFYGVTRALQFDGYGGVQDIVFNTNAVGVSAGGSIAVYLDILASSPTTQQIPGRYNVNYYADNNDARSTTVSSYSIAASPVPITTTFWLFGSGLVGFLGFIRRKTSVVA